MRGELFIVTPKKCIFWILYACIVFSAAYSLFGISLSTFYLCDVLNLMLHIRTEDNYNGFDYGECYYCCIATKT